MTNLNIGDTVKWITDEDTVIGVVLSVGDRIELKTAYGLMEMPCTDGKFVKTNETVPVRKVDDAVVKTAATTTKKKLEAGSKIAQAVELYKNNREASRQELINLFVDKLGMTPAGASTYASQVKKYA